MFLQRQYIQKEKTQTGQSFYAKTESVLSILEQGEEALVLALKVAGIFKQTQFNISIPVREALSGNWCSLPSWVIPLSTNLYLGFASLLILVC